VIVLGLTVCDCFNAWRKKRRAAAASRLPLRRKSIACPRLSAATMNKSKNEFGGWHFTADVIPWAVRWYLQFPISYRDLERMLADRGVSVDHTTVSRWTQRYAPEIDKRMRPHLEMTNGSWRVDETYIKVKGRWTYRYRAVGTGHGIAHLILIASNRLLRLPSWWTCATSTTRRKWPGTESYSSVGRGST
jgi:DDE domain